MELGNLQIIEHFAKTITVSQIFSNEEVKPGFDFLGVHRAPLGARLKLCEGDTRIHRIRWAIIIIDIQFTSVRPIR